ncbi:MAG: TrbI/VirB10 family protein [Erythrobacter sp.]|uniref:TrbI/VirB10 family protein n=1 Tax=Erythrobacter sp. TaxID=1042 RepID=UPI00261AD500|nr:TrbI/VirB10 family protein [Erythrobacter sp.]MDJ0978609.1 TrbI/VirB10 family protein [Erythrobacter sp.]
MRLAMRLPPKKSDNGAFDAGDPREGESAEIIDLASRSAFPAVTDRKSKTDGLGLAAGVAIVGALGAVTLWSMNAAQVPEPETIGSAQVAAAAPAPAPVAPQPVSPEPAPRRPDPTPAPILTRAPDTNPALASNPYASPIMPYDASVPANSAVAAPPAVGGGAPATGAQAGAVAGSAAAFASSIGGVGGAPVQATPMTNPSTTVTQGTLIPAVLETAINTDVPGYVRAVVSQDVRSFDGTRILVPRSSRLIGQYQSGVQQGQKRAYVIWTRLIRPDGVSVNLASPAVAFDGTTGLEGDVNSHFFKRFGSSMLLSVIGGLGGIVSGGTSVFLGGAQTASPDAGISPTIRVKMGEPIRVFTSRDLDFSTVSN